MKEVQEEGWALLCSVAPRTSGSAQAAGLLASGSLWKPLEASGRRCFLCCQVLAPAVSHTRSILPGLLLDSRNQFFLFILQLCAKLFSDPSTLGELLLPTSPRTTHLSFD